MTRRMRGVAAAAVASVVLAGCSSVVPATKTSGSSAAAPVRRPPVTITTTTTTTTTPPRPTAARAARPVDPVGAVAPQGLGEGDRGPQVAALERALEAQRYDVGQVDDLFDVATRHAVIAFQKVNDLPRTGRATSDVVDRLPTAQPPAPLVPAGPPTRVEIDLARQVLLLYEGNALYRILPVSSGSGRRFCEGGYCRRAVTPAGKFEVYRRISGWRKSDLGRLFNPLYFNEGIAIHGFPSVPPTPASHGCVRIPMDASRWFPQRVPDGTTVYVLDGKTEVAA